MASTNRLIQLLLLAFSLIVINSNKINSNINNSNGNINKKISATIINTMNTNSNNESTSKTNSFSNTIIKTNSKSRRNNNNHTKFRLILPKVTPHFDTRYLIAFGSDNCDHCNQMEPVLKRLEKDLGYTCIIKK